MDKFGATLVVMAAGMGSRFGGLKQIAPVGKNGEAILDFSVYDAVEAGFSKVVFVINHRIEEEFKAVIGKRIAKMAEVEYVFQEKDVSDLGFDCPETREKPWGTGHAVLCCRNAVKTPFAVINADDYYGKSAFKQIYNQLKNDKDNYCMVGFKLSNTLTENGHVSRGVCEVEDGFLRGITERTKITSDCRYTEDDVNWYPLSSDSVVSMNMWGFTPDYFDYLERGFKGFLEQNINEPKKEFYLLTVIDELINSGEKQVKVLASEDKWYGVTYKEDTESVVSAIGKLIDDGFYKNM